MSRFWASWWSGFYSEDGCTTPPFENWTSGSRGVLDGNRVKEELSLCAVIDGDNAVSVEALILKHYPDATMRFCDPAAPDFTPDPGRFPP